MLWVLWDIVLPLIATFLLGLFIGWLLWRWRRRRIDADGLSKLRRDAARHKSDVERLQQSNIELSDRLQAASSAGGGDLASANKRIDMLSEELKSSRGEVANLKNSERARGAGSATADTARLTGLQAELRSARQRITELEQSSAGTETANSEICLLYTSPSPRDATLSRMPSSA